MKNKLKEEMLEAIFIQTGGRPENPKIAEVCAEIAVKAISSNAMLAVSLPDIRNRLTPFKNLIALLKDASPIYHPDERIQDLIEKEMGQCEINIEWLSGNDR